MKKSILSIAAIVLLACFTILNLQFNELANEENKLLLADIFAISLATAECGDSGATVSCKDAEHYGSGVLRARICVDNNNNCYCDHAYYKLPATDGTCTP